MDMKSKSCTPEEDEWFLVISKSGAVAVVAGQDFSFLPASVPLVFQAKLEPLEARYVAGSLSRASDMSANHRIKAGESGGVG